MLNCVTHQKRERDLLGVIHYLSWPTRTVTLKLALSIDWVEKDNMVKGWMIEAKHTSWIYSDSVPHLLPYIKKTRVITMKKRHRRNLIGDDSYVNQMSAAFGKEVLCRNAPAFLSDCDKPGWSCQLVMLRSMTKPCKCKSTCVSAQGGLKPPVLIAVLWTQ